MALLTMSAQLANKSMFANTLMKTVIFVVEKTVSSISNLDLNLLNTQMN